MRCRWGIRTLHVRDGDAPVLIARTGSFSALLGHCQKPAGWVPGNFLGNWYLSAITTIQSGNALTIAETNSSNVFGISEDRAKLSARCSKAPLVRKESVESRLDGYFNNSCFTTPPVIGADGIETAFGNSATGIVAGPGQANLYAFSKAVLFNWPHEASTLLFRAEFYNTLNHPQFVNPGLSFGVISSTAVNPRVTQLALKLTF